MIEVWCRNQGERTQGCLAWKNLLEWIHFGKPPVH